MALGASQACVVLDIVRTAFLLAAVGIVLGGAAAFAATRLLASSLFSVSRADPMTFSLTAVIVMVVSLVASAIPAYKGAEVDPNVRLTCRWVACPGASAN
jgi:ABC-type antimicrobial peptide transport system permease subunit